MPQFLITNLRADLYAFKDRTCCSDLMLSDLSRSRRSSDYHTMAFACGVLRLLVSLVADACLAALKNSNADAGCSRFH